MSSSSSDTKTYLIVYGMLIGLLTVSIPATIYGHGTAGTVIIYGIAVSKAYLVLKNYMHLELEPWFVTAILGGCFIAMVYMFLLLYPDLVWEGMAGL
ncbi:MAG: cytochrome C oxidase subunit IV family protein [bacterium]